MAALLASPDAQAHNQGAEFLFAKLTLCRNQECLLEVTADYGGNPMIHGEEDARHAITGELAIAADEEGNKATFESAGPPRIEKRQKLDPSTPGYESGNAEPHQLMTAIWRWRPSGRSLVLQVPPGTSHDALLWTVDQNRPEEKPRWTLLIAGDRSPVIQIPKRGAMPVLMWSGAVGVVMLAGFLWMRWRRAPLVRRVIWDS